MLAVFSCLTSVSTRPLVFRFHALIFHASTCFSLSRSNFRATTRAEKPGTPGARDTTMTSILYKLLKINYFKQLY